MIKFKKLCPHATTPRYATPDAAGLDLTAAWPEPNTCTVITPGERRLVPTGLAIQVPKGFEAQVRPRSGLALKFGITVLNSPGTIDADYRGPVGVVLVNHGSEPFVVNTGDRIAQLVIAPVVQEHFVLVDELDSTERGEGGFGSTGTK